ncbi:uncharacterized protein LACBIDRAFT_317319 [Laccaria bicolor S238N-H82]|uniref:Predicted protein n=1 Tax=Laccaria bicolor (strain S238N-H82 / ATCC MYA-4686) TaxID=486041 RepID=B0D4W9_LACBS|nr:uncharacterized protein LACBIDRAFT_317319 [Laccaria bicolor S238N-H82]EDR10637.1 predicted protein [Laccaria bicolor S238N-H82]|eukprot:XP_001879087.1 predicted protein [Laccaria bicolor S238N-H82]
MSNHFHDTAKSGCGTGTNELYDRIRPSYQAPASSFIRASHAMNIVDRRIGVGTGIFTRALLAQPEWDSPVKEIRAIEPSEGTRSMFSKVVNDERISINQGTFDATGIESGRSHSRCTAAEFDRILKPKIWRTSQVVQVGIHRWDQAAWVAQVRERLERHEEGTPQFRLGLLPRGISDAS